MGGGGVPNLQMEVFDFAFSSFLVSVSLLSVVGEMYLEVVVPQSMVF